MRAFTSFDPANGHEYEYEWCLLRYDRFHPAVAAVMAHLDAAGYQPRPGVPSLHERDAWR